MNARDLAIYQVYRKVQEFLDRWAAFLGGINDSAVRKQFDALVETLAMYVARQHSRDDVEAGGAAGVEALRISLLEDHIEPIVLMVPIIQKRIHSLVVKPPKSGAGPMELCADARAIVTLVGGLVNEFVELGLEPNFIDRLKVATDVLDAAITAAGSANATVSSASAGVVSTITGANERMAVLHALVRKALRGNVGLMAEWDAVRRMPSHQAREGMPRRPRQRALTAGPSSVVAAVLPARSEQSPSIPADAEVVVDAPRRLWVRAKHLIGRG